MGMAINIGNGILLCTYLARLPKLSPPSRQVMSERELMNLDSRIMDDTFFANQSFIQPFYNTLSPTCPLLGLCASVHWMYIKRVEERYIFIYPLVLRYELLTFMVIYWSAWINHMTFGGKSYLRNWSNQFILKYYPLSDGRVTYESKSMGFDLIVVAFHLCKMI